MLKINNTLSKQKEEFTPLTPPIVKMYTCGVTVYDSCHIGHARSLYVFDVMRRYLKYRGYDVKFVRNITDIDDKIINRANELKIDWKSLVEKYIASYYEDLLALGVDKADFEPRATENIPDMIKYIEVLIQKGYAYAAGGDVYFDVRKFPEYGKLSRQNIEEMETGVRIEPTNLKKDPLDFALWKASKEGEPSWQSPWGNGRPGWHIECSVMSQKFLKTETLDIHAGGRDLIFPHHENEVAQAEAYSGKSFAKYWIHHGLLTINGQKMSKSLGNFVTIKDFADKYGDLDYLKLIFLSTHYRSPLDYTEKKIEEAKKEKERFGILLMEIRDKKTISKHIDDAQNQTEIDKFKKRFEDAMDDDFNMPLALAVLFDLVIYANKFIHGKDSFSEKDMIVLEQIEKVLLNSLAIFGIANPFEQIKYKSHFSTTEVEEEYIRDMAAKRDEARTRKDFKTADEIRKKLLDKGIILEDAKEGKTRWRRKL